MGHPSTPSRRLSVKVTHVNPCGLTNGLRRSDVSTEKKLANGMHRKAKPCGATTGGNVTFTLVHLMYEVQQSITVQRWYDASLKEHT